MVASTRRILDSFCFVLTCVELRHFIRRIYIWFTSCTSIKWNIMIPFANWQLEIDSNANKQHWNGCGTCTSAGVCACVCLCCFVIWKFPYQHHFSPRLLGIPCFGSAPSPEDVFLNNNSNNEFHACQMYDCQRLCEIQEFRACCLYLIEVVIVIVVGVAPEMTITAHILLFWFQWQTEAEPISYSMKGLDASLGMCSVVTSSICEREQYISSIYSSLRMLRRGKKCNFLSKFPFLHTQSANFWTQPRWIDKCVWHSANIWKQIEMSRRDERKTIRILCVHYRQHRCDCFSVGQNRMRNGYTMQWIDFP